MSPDDYAALLAAFTLSESELLAWKHRHIRNILLGPPVETT